MEEYFVSDSSLIHPWPLGIQYFLYDLFIIIYKTDFASYVDDNIPSVAANHTDGLIKSLEIDSAKLFQWFTDKKLNITSDKFHFLTSDGTKDYKNWEN